MYLHIDKALKKSYTGLVSPVRSPQHFGTETNRSKISIRSGMCYYTYEFRIERLAQEKCYYPRQDSQ